MNYYFFSQRITQDFGVCFFNLVHLALFSFSPSIPCTEHINRLIHFFTTSSIRMNLSGPSHVWKVCLVSKVTCYINQDLLLIGAHKSDTKILLWSQCFESQKVLCVGWVAPITIVPPSVQLFLKMPKYKLTCVATSWFCYFSFSCKKSELKAVPLNVGWIIMKENDLFLKK